MHGLLFTPDFERDRIRQTNIGGSEGEGGDPAEGGTPFSQMVRHITHVDVAP